MSVDTVSQKSQNEFVTKLVFLAKGYAQQLITFGALVAIYIFFMIAAPNFAEPSVLSDILMKSAAIGVMALGATFVIATSGIDLSVGTGMTVCAVMAGVFLGERYLGLNIVLGIILTLLIGVLLGVTNGVNVAYLNIPPFIATLAMMMACQGIALIISGASTIQISNPGYYAVANGNLIPGLANSALVFLGSAIIASVILNKTLIGRYALSIGSNKEATQLAGINVKFWLMIVYIVAGIFTALGAILYSARFGFSQPAEGLGMELNAIAAVVIGGTSLAGGRANISGTVIGTLIMNTLTTGLQMMGLPNEWQLPITGVVVLLAVFIDNVRQRRENAA